LQALQNMIFSANGQGDITIAQSGGQIKIASDGSIHIQAPRIDVMSQQNNLVGSAGHLGGQESSRAKTTSSN
jgi:hypothetical protein